MMLCLLLLVGLFYGAQVFVTDSKAAAETSITDNGDDNAERGEENVKETSHHLFVLEKMRYHLKPVASIVVNLNAPIETALPEPYLQLNTPPPDFA